MKSLVRRWRLADTRTFNRCGNTPILCRRQQRRNQVGSSAAACGGHTGTDRPCFRKNLKEFASAFFSFNWQGMKFTSDGESVEIESKWALSWVWGWEGFHCKWEWGILLGWLMCFWTGLGWRLCTSVNFIKIIELHIFSFLLNLLGWHWLMKLYRFQGYSSIIHHLYTVLCVHHPKSSLLSFFKKSQELKAVWF